MTKYECGDSRGLIEYVYDECDEAERMEVSAHLAVCTACTAELAALKSTRQQLAAWAPPDVNLGFRVVSESVQQSNVVRPFRWLRGGPPPVWAQAAAALLIFATGLVLGVAQGVGRDGAEGVRATRGEAAGSASAVAVTQSDLAALEVRLRAELAQLPARSAAVAAPEAVVASEAEMLSRVRTLIDESEQRQRRELALRTAEVVRDIDAQRQLDWVRVQRALGQFEGTAGAEIQRQRQEINRLLQRVSQRP